MTSALAQPLTLPCGTVLPNRLMKSAMSEALADRRGGITPALLTLYRRWAEGGVGLCVTGNVMIDARALGEHGNVVLEDERDLAQLEAWAGAGTAQGTQLWMQLNHPGKQVPRGLNRETVAPSAVGFGAQLAPFFSTPRALTEAEIHDLIARFARSAALAQRAGFSGVQIHGAHGYLVSQFLSPRHNQRDDAWGGSPERRQRFALEVYRAMRAAVGPKFPVGIKLNSADFQKGGMTEDESLGLVASLAAEGIDLIEVSGGTYEAPVMAKGVEQKESTRVREAYFLEFAQKARAQVRTPLAVTGGFRTRAAMQDALAAGALDVVGMARALAVDPTFPQKLLAGDDTPSFVRPIHTGIAAVDRMGMMEVSWYTRQLHRMGRGKEPALRESPKYALAATLAAQGMASLFSRKRA
jgi:2,4-dienoyl-CoA reductase-like NADH-dependent reductase (Old Yellow Enzyme family)